MCNTYRELVHYKCRGNRSPVTSQHALSHIPTLDKGYSYFLLQQSPPQRHPLLQLPSLLVVLCVCLHLDFALVSIEQLKLLLQLHPQHLTLRLLSFIQPQLREGAKKQTYINRFFCGCYALRKH